jgi:hypothetical protein
MRAHRRGLPRQPRAKAATALLRAGGGWEVAALRVRRVEDKHPGRHSDDAQCDRAPTATEGRSLGGAPSRVAQHPYGQNPHRSGSDCEDVCQRAVRTAIAIPERGRAEVGDEREQEGPCDARADHRDRRESQRPSMHLCHGLRIPGDGLFDCRGPQSCASALRPNRQRREWQAALPSWTRSSALAFGSEPRPLIALPGMDSSSVSRGRRRTR